MVLLLRLELLVNVSQEVHRVMQPGASIEILEDGVFPYLMLCDRTNIFVRHRYFLSSATEVVYSTFAGQSETHTICLSFERTSTHVLV